MTPKNTTISLPEITAQLLSNLDTRSRDIVSRRYGLENGKTETLESIGQEYGITRERVRQIESQAKKALAGLSELTEPVASVFTKTFDVHGGLLESQYVVQLLQRSFVGQDLYPSVVRFYLELLPPYTFVSRDATFLPHWAHPELVREYVATVAQEARDVLKAKKQPVAETELLQQLPSAQAVPAEHALAALVASKHVAVTPFSEWGLVDWPETSPRGVGDKAYAVLRRHGKPEHFTEITRLINNAQFDHKVANSQTVHNELIKDSRFVLVGRGLYGLTEWGFIPGTVADVLASILEKAKEPLTRDELVKQVLAQRQVKKNTILLGLQEPRAV